MRSRTSCPKHEKLIEYDPLTGNGLHAEAQQQSDTGHRGREGAGGRQAGEAMAEGGAIAGTHLWMQLSHAGRQTPKLVATEPVGPSDRPVAIPGGRFGKPRALTGEEIRNVIECFTYAAGVARQTGFTGVQVHSAHGYLLSEFLSPTNSARPR